MPDAYGDAVALLARRPLTRREVAERLMRKGHDPDAVDAALVRLVAAGAINDASLARHWVTTQAARGRGRERALASLIERGVDPATAASAWSDAVADDTFDPAQVLARAVRRRLGAVPRAVPMPKLARVYNALLSEGFATGDLEAALAPYGFRRDDA